MLFTIVATGNHFIFDAAAGGLVVVIAYVAARALVAPRATRPASTGARPARHLPRQRLRTA